LPLYRCQMTLVSAKHPHLSTEQNHRDIHIMARFVLASGSAIRSQLLHQANLPHEAVSPRIDEAMVKQAMCAEKAPPRDIADALAEMKARKISEKQPDALVLGCDQVLDFKGELLSKPIDQADAIEQLTRLQNNRHMLLSAAVLYENAQPVWRHIAHVRLHMRSLSHRYIEGYVARNWDSIRHSVGCYKLEEEGVRLFTRIEGDYFAVLGLPLLELLSYLAVRGEIET